MKRVLSGIQPTSESFHLGNYLGAVRQWVELQNGNEAYYSIVDLHALTGDVDPKLLRARTLASAAQLIAVGIDTDKSALFVQSHLPEHNQLGWLMECTASFGEASRMTQFKDKSSKGGSDSARVGLFTYPMLQAADILLYQANLVPVGEDQRQHIEITRDLANRFNTRNLITIYSVVTGKSNSEIENEFAGKGYGDFKGAVSDATVEFLKPMREKALDLLKDEGELIRILERGAEKAKVLASKTLKDAYKALGILG